MGKSYNDKISLMIEKADALLVRHGIQRIQDNEDFIMDELWHEDYVVYTIHRDQSIALRLAWSPDGVDIGVNDFYEVHSIAYEEIANDAKRYLEYLDDLIFKSVIIETCAFGLTRYYARDETGRIKLFRKVRFGCMGLLFIFLPSICCNRIEYSPVYKNGS